MLNCTHKPRRIIIERVDLRTDPRAKTDIFRITIGEAIYIEMPPEELRKLVKIARSFKEIKNKKKAQS